MHFITDKRKFQEQIHAEKSLLDIELYHEMPVLAFEMPVLAFAGIISGVNAFLPMLMVGEGFALTGDRTQIGAVIRTLLLVI